MSEVAGGTFRQPPKKRVHHVYLCNNTILRKSFNDLRQILPAIRRAVEFRIIRIIPVDSSDYAVFAWRQRDTEFSHLLARFTEPQKNGIFLKGLRILRQFGGGRTRPGNRMIRIGIQLEFAGGYGRGVLRGVMEYAHLRADWKFVMPPMYSLAKQQWSDPQSADALVVMVHSARSLERFRRVHVPVVNAARTMSLRELRRVHLPSVLPDDAAVGRMAFDYFRQRGFRSFGFCGHPTASWSRVRCRAFENECRKNDLSFSSVAASDRVPREWVRSLPRPCAVLCANDRYAWHAIDVCRENGMSVPEDIAVLGVDNDLLLTRLVHPTLSSIDLGAERIGFEAARVLDELIQGKRTSREPIELPPSGVVTRHSTDILSIDDEVVAEAVRFIRERASKLISVDDVLKEVAMSRRNLERRFRRSMRHSLHDEIRRVHLDRAAKLLRETNLGIPYVAEQSGFASHVRFTTVFREWMQTTPTDYRRQHRSGMGEQVIAGQPGELAETA